MNTFRTSTPATYIPPSGEEMREAANKVGLNSFSRDLVADLCNLAAGGRVLPPSAYRSVVQESAERTLPAPQEGWHHRDRKVPGWKLRSGQWTTDRMAAVSDRTEGLLRYHQNVCDFLQTVDLSKFPGESPLQQAMALLKLLSKQKGGEGGGEAGEPLPIFTDNDQSEKVGETLNDLMDEVDSLSDEEKDMIDPSGDAHEVSDSPEGDGTRSGSKGLDRLKVAEDLAPGSDKRAMLDISRTLDQFTKLKARKQVKVGPTPDGEEIRRRPIKDVAELAKVPTTAWATYRRNKAYFLYQAVSHQLPVRERVTRLERKQAIFILVDGSGSMRGKKHWKATGVVMNRLKAVLSGDAEVFVSVFDTNLGKVRRASTPQEARDLIRDFASGNFTGGGTDIGAAVKAAHKFVEEQIKAGAALYRPEICVLTDEDSSSSSVSRGDIPGTRVHGFAMEVANPSLVAFAESTGGLGIDKF